MIATLTGNADLDALLHSKVLSNDYENLIVTEGESVSNSIEKIKENLEGKKAEGLMQEIAQSGHRR